MKLGKDLLNKVVVEETLGTKTLHKRVSKDEHLAILGGKRGLAGRLGLDLDLDIDRLGSGGHFESTGSCEIYRTFFQEKDVQFYHFPRPVSEIQSWKYEYLVFLDTGFSLNHSFLVMSLISRFIKNTGFNDSFVQILDFRIKRPRL